MIKVSEVLRDMKRLGGFHRTDYPLPEFQRAVRLYIRSGRNIDHAISLAEKEEEERPDRVLSRTLIRVVDIDPKGVYFYVVIPGWNVRKNVRIDYDSFPDEMRPLVTIGKRFHARVNVGAETRKDLYFDSWEND